LALHIRYREHAIKGIDAEIAELQGRIEELQRMRAGIGNSTRGRASNESISAVEAPPVAQRRGPGRPKGRRFSPEARKRLSEAMKKRWAERRKSAK
jgi:hypothetical protein